MRIAAIALAGAAGAVLRYAVTSAIGVRSFPAAVAGINLTGSFLLGLLVGVAARRGWPATTTVPLAVGFLGSFTTFSAFSFDTQALLRDGRIRDALLYVSLSVLGGTIAAAWGYAAAHAAD